MPKTKQQIFKFNKPTIDRKLRSKPVYRVADSAYDFEAWKLPETLGNAPKEVMMANDSAFQNTQSLLEHALDGAYSMGYPAFLGFPTLTGLSQHPLIRAGVEARTNSMTAKWGDVVSNTADKKDKTIETKIKCITESMEKHNVKELFNQACDYCGYFGGCYLFIDNGDKQEEYVNPLLLTKETFKTGSFRGFRMIEPYLVTPCGYNAVNPMASDYFNPSVYYIQGIPVHKSRLIIFRENELPTLLRPAYNFMGISLSQRVLDSVCHYTESREAMVRMLLKCSTMVFKSDMSDIFNGGAAEAMEMRVKYFAQNRDNDGVAVIDKDREDLAVLNTTLAGMSDIVQRCQEDVCSNFREPAVKIFGLSPAGFNTGETDLANHIENIMISQDKLFGKPMKKVLKVIQMNLWGEIDSNLSFKFAPLNEQDEATKLQNELTKANIDNILMQIGALQNEDVRARLLKDEDSGYDTLAEMKENPMAKGMNGIMPMGEEGGEGEEVPQQSTNNSRQQEGDSISETPNKQPIQ